MEITIAERTFLSLDWALLTAAAAAAGTVATAVVAWVQLAGFRRESQLSRRPVIETKVLKAPRVEIQIVEADGTRTPRIRRAIVIRLENVGEGRAVGIRAYGHFEPIESIGAEPTLLTDGDIEFVVSSAAHRVSAENLRPGEIMELTLAGPAYTEDEDPLSGWTAARVLVTYEDVYGTPFHPQSEAVTGFGSAAEAAPPPPGSVLRRI